MKPGMVKKIPDSTKRSTDVTNGAAKNRAFPPSPLPFHLDSDVFRLEYLERQAGDDDAEVDPPSPVLFQDDISTMTDNEEAQRLAAPKAHYRGELVNEDQ